MKIIHKTRKIVQLAVTCLLLSQANNVLAVQTQDPAIVKSKIDKYLSSLVEKRFAGSVLVEYQGKKLLSKGYGKTAPDAERENTPDTVYDLLSITKQFTGAAIVKLEQQGKLAVTDRLKKYFPNAPKDKADITLHQLLTHSSGLTGGIGSDYEAISKAQFISAALASELQYKPGSKYRYSNLGYSLLGIIIEKASGTDYEDYLYTNLFKPAGMENTGYTRPDFKREKVAASLTRSDIARPNELPWDKNGPFWHLKANGGLLTTTEDMYKWHQALKDNTILSLTAKAKYLYPHISEDPEYNQSYYGYGWVITSTPRKTKVLTHNGGNPAFSSDIARFVDEQAAIILLSNVRDSFSYQILREIEGILFEPGYQPKDKTQYLPLAQLLAKTKDINQVVEYIENAYKSQSASDYAMSNRAINSFGYRLLQQNKTKAAGAIFALNTRINPQSANAFDSYGEYLLAQSKTQKAVEMYQKALTIDPDYPNAAHAKKVIKNQQ